MSKSKLPYAAYRDACFTHPTMAEGQTEIVRCSTTGSHEIATNIGVNASEKMMIGTGLYQRPKIPRIGTRAAVGFVASIAMSMTDEHEWSNEMSILHIVLNCEVLTTGELTFIQVTLSLQPRTVFLWELCISLRELGDSLTLSFTASGLSRRTWPHEHGGRRLRRRR